jgi:hypothetical protein
MRRRSNLATQDLPVVPAALRRFRLHDWRDPSLDPPPEPWEPYTSAEDRFMFHAVKAIGRWKAARQAWEVEHGLQLRDVWEAHLAEARSLQELNANYAADRFIEFGGVDPRWEVPDAPQV